jgi:hypothetical protein
VGTRIKHMGHEANHSPPSCAEIKNEWRYISAYAVCLHGMDKENFTFAFT